MRKSMHRYHVNLCERGSRNRRSIQAWLIASATLFLLTEFVMLSGKLNATELTKLSRGNWESFRIRGKEVDHIYGDFVMRNEHIALAIGQPLPTRNANMTVKNVGGCLIDLGTREASNDQLSCFFPLGPQFRFIDSSKVTIVVDRVVTVLGEDRILNGDLIEVNIVSEPRSDGSYATVTYRLHSDWHYVEIETRVTNDGDETIQFNTRDTIRADRTFRTDVFASTNAYYAYDEWFRACYAFVTDTKSARRGNNAIEYVDQEGGFSESVESGESHSFLRRVYFAPSELEMQGLLEAEQGEKVSKVSLLIEDEAGPVKLARVVLQKDGEEIGVGRTDSDGAIRFDLVPAEYAVKVDAIGRPTLNAQLDANADLDATLTMENCGYIRLVVTDTNGEPIPCKVSFYGVDGTEDPFFGPDSKATAVHNTRYTPTGRFRQEMGPGDYDVVISRGPEYDAIVESVSVVQGITTIVEGELERVIETPGWISAEYHSHSTPSGDNTSMQYGRVLNLLAENIEFAPCTEHNRIDSYSDHISQLNAERYLATCSGMELTGNPLPINHQNAFPLRRRIRQQDGGGPVTDVDPVVQIERLAMWDYGSDKLVQVNHPNLIQMLGDRDNDRQPDEGFRDMFQFMDVIEVHPPERIFERPTEYPAPDNRGNVIFNWLQLLNLGYRIPGVVNTDAHYNFHGSGWLRNYVRSSTDNPEEISVSEMVQSSEQGNIVMTTGPYLEVKVTGDASNESFAGPGDDVSAALGMVTVDIRVQCANWLDVNRVQIFVNGEMPETLNFTRRTHPDWFSNDVVKFEHSVELTLEEDTHVIVAAIGEGLSLGRVMGPSAGNRVPVAVANPIFVDVDGGGFQVNRDRLGAPLPLEEDVSIGQQR